MGKVKLLLLLIILIAAILRLWGLGTIPPSPDWDEAALGYNAYSIMQTGRDEYGKQFPIILQSFDDYKPALYAYLTMLPISLFGFTTFSVRLPSAILGILTVLAVYFLVEELFDKWKPKNWENAFSILALITSFLLAISPWHIQFSRVAFETNAGLAFNIFAVLFFLKGLKKPWFIPFSVVSMVLSLNVYQSEKIFVPLLASALVVIYRKEFFRLPKRYIITSILVGIILLAPVVQVILTDKNSLLRAKGVSIFNEQNEIVHSSQLKYLQDKNSQNLLGQLLHNRRIVYIIEVLAGFFSHFNFNWLFMRGDIARHHAPHMGLLYLWELPFLLYGIYKFLFSDFTRKTKLFLFSWFLIAPIPASFTSGVPHAVRTLNFLPTFQIFTAIGVLSAFLYMSENKIFRKFLSLKILPFALIFLIVGFNFSYYLDQYFVQQNYFSSEEWQYGYQQAVAEAKFLENKYQKIIVSNQPPLDQSYIFFLFYLKYPPSMYQHEDVHNTAGFRENHAFGKYEFRPINWNKEDKNSKILYVGRPNDFPNEDKKFLKVINYLNGEPAIVIIEG